MPDETRIRLTVEDNATGKANEANKAIIGVEETSERAFKNQVKRLTQEAALYGKVGSARAEARKALEVGRFQSFDAASGGKLTAVHDQLISRERALEEQLRRTKLAAMERDATLRGKVGSEATGVKRDFALADAKALGASVAQLDKIAKSYDQVIAQQRVVEAQGKGILGVLGGWKNALTGAAAAILGFKAVQAILGAPGKIIEVTTAYQQYAMGLRAVSSDAAEAKSKLAELQIAARQPGLDVDQTIGGVVKLESAGIGFTKSVDMVKAFGNALAVVGGTSEDLKGVIIALTQIAATPFVQGDEIRQLQERLPQIRFLMQEAFGTSRTEELKKLGITSAEFLEKLTAGAQKLGKAGNTFSTATTQFWDSLKFIVAETFEGPVKGLQSMVEKLTTALRVSSDLRQEWARLAEEKGIPWTRPVERLRLGAQLGLSEATNGFFAPELLQGFLENRLRTQARTQQKNWFTTGGMWGESGPKTAADLKGAVLPGFDLKAQQAKMFQAFGIEDPQKTEASLKKMKDALADLRKQREFGLISAGQLAAAEAKIKSAMEDANPLLVEYRKRTEELAKARDRGRKALTDMLAEQSKERTRDLDALRKREDKTGLRTDFEDGLDAALDADERRRRALTDLNNFASGLQEQYLNDSLARREEVLRNEKALALENLGSIRDTSIQSKIQVEQARLAIEEQFADKSLTLQKEKIDRETSEAISSLKQRALAAGLDTAGISGQIAAIEALGAQRRADLEKSSVSDMERLRLDSSGRINDILMGENQRLWNAMRSGFESTLDHMLSGAGSFADAMRDILKAAFFTPLKQMASRIFADLFTPLARSMRGGFPGAAASGGYGGGGWGGLGEVLPSIGIAGIGGWGGGLGGWGGQIGRTPPFWGGGSGGGMLGDFGGLGMPSLGGWAGGTGGGWRNALGGTWGRWKDILEGLGNIGMKDNLPSNMTGAGGVGGWQGGALLLGGGILGGIGLKRGGWSGVGMSTAGGAMIGTKFGGPMGALIGGAIGFGAGIVRLFIKGAEDKAIQKVKDLYSITIDKQFARQIVDAAKSQYGGNLDLTIRTADMRELILLYGMSTNQDRGLSDDRPRGVFLSQRGGVLSQTGYGGYGYQSILPSAPGLRTYTPKTVQIVNVTIQADGQATSDLIEGRQVAFLGTSSGSVAVQGANQRAMSASVGRRATGALLLDPLAVGA
jgi:tape measure domain-containing protein